MKHIDKYPFGYSVAFKNRRSGMLKWIDVPGENIDVITASVKAREYCGLHQKKYGREYGVSQLFCVKLPAGKQLYTQLSELCKNLGLHWSHAAHLESLFRNKKERVFQLTNQLYLEISCG
jgi:hypothetical protein